MSCVPRYVPTRHPEGDGSVIEIDYDIWYCPSFPVSKINESRRFTSKGRDALRLKLAEHINKNGLLNPLIVLNHRPIRRDKESRHGPNRCRTGRNKLAAILHLGWATVPAIVTGNCPYQPRALADPITLHNYFRDGELIFDDEGPRLISATRLVNAVNMDLTDTPVAPGEGLA